MINTCGCLSPKCIVCVCSGDVKLSDLKQKELARQALKNNVDLPKNQKNHIKPIEKKEISYPTFNNLSKKQPLVKARIEQLRDRLKEQIVTTPQAVIIEAWLEEHRFDIMKDLGCAPVIAYEPIIGCACVPSMNLQCASCSQAQTNFESQIYCAVFSELYIESHELFWQQQIDLACREEEEVLLKAHREAYEEERREEQRKEEAKVNKKRIAEVDSIIRSGGVLGDLGGMDNFDGWGSCPEYDW